MFYEIVWTLYGEEWSFGTFDDYAEALAAFNNGPPRVSKLIHGGSLRLDLIVEVPCNTEP